MKDFKQTGGFTLLELIVVIAILAILAAAAVPVYSGYIRKAQEAKDLQVLTNVNTALSAALATEPDVAVTVDVGMRNDVIVTFDGSDAAQTAEAYEQYMADNSERLIYYVDAVYEDGVVTGVKAPR